MARLQPLTAKDVSLMLRSGYSAAAVEQEVAARHFLGAIDPVAEKSLVQSGAAPAFLASLKSGAYAVPPEEVIAVQQELTAKEQRRAIQAEESKKLNTLYQSQLAQARAAASQKPSAGPHVLLPLVRGDLVVSNDGAVKPFNDQALEKKKLIGLYFSAHWCGPCRKFTPDLVAFYNRVAASHPEFEIIFISNDRSASAMETYMRESKMPWPALQFDKSAKNEPLRKYAGSGIPCLVIIDPDGRVVSDSYAGAQYLGPAKVLEDLERIFATSSTNQVALRR